MEDAQIAGIRPRSRSRSVGSSPETKRVKEDELGNDEEKILTDGINAKSSSENRSASSNDEDNTHPTANLSKSTAASSSTSDPDQDDVPVSNRDHDDATPKESDENFRVISSLYRLPEEVLLTVTSYLLPVSDMWSRELPHAEKYGPATKFELPIPWQQREERPPPLQNALPVWSLLEAVRSHHSLLIVRRQRLQAGDGDTKSDSEGNANWAVDCFH
jgi:hypothetical protein